MSARDIRSFFKPITKTQINNPTKQRDSGNVKPVAKQTKSSTPTSKKTEKIISKKKEVISSDSEDDDHSSSRSNQPKAEVKKNSKGSRTKDRKNSSDDDPDVSSGNVKPVAKKTKSSTPTSKKTSKIISKKIEVISSDSEDDHSSRKSNQPKAELKKNGKGSKTKDRKNSSDDDPDVIESTPVKLAKTKKGKIHILSSDSEDDKPQKKAATILQSKNGKMEDKLKPVSVTDLFSKTVKQSKMKNEAPPKSPKAETKSNKRVKTTKGGTTELGIHQDVDFEKTLIDLDDDIFIQNEDILDRTIESAMVKSPVKIRSENKSVERKDRNLIANTDTISRKRTLEKDSSEKEDTPSKSKKTKLEHVDSGIDDQERFEMKRYCASQYNKYLNRSGPKNQGCKEYPKGKPDCLSNLCFLKTGVLDSLDSEEFTNLIKQHGGRTVLAVSKKVDYVVSGDDAGPAKLAKARTYSIPIIDEDELLDMILEKSGMPKKFTTSNKTFSFEDAGINDSFKSIDNDISVENKLKNSKSENDNMALKKTDKNKVNKTNIDELKEMLTPSTSQEVDQEIETEALKTNESQPVIEKTEVDNTYSCLSEKYKPKVLKEVVGQQMNNSNLNKLKKWLEDWHYSEKLRKQKKIPQPTPWNKNHDGCYYKCALLSGPPGVGKTTTASLVAKSLGFEIIEFNASDTRSKTHLQHEVATALTTRNISFDTNTENNIKRVILMDEVDGMAGNEDRGGMQELINLIKKTKIPIICMCNDRNHQKMRSLANYCFDLRFDKPKPQQILGFVLSICCKEGIKVPPPVLMEIINATTCDIRQTLNQISMIANMDEGLTIEQAQKDSAASKKDTILGPWQVCKMVFNEDDQKNMSFIDKSRLFFYDYSMGPLFVQENYLKVQPNVDRKKLMNHVALAAEAISMGATIDQKIRQFNNWSLLDTQAIFSSVLPGHYMSGHFTAAIDFPSYLGKYSKKNKHKRLINELALHSRLQTSGGALAMNLDYSKVLLNSILTPLKKRGVGGVSEAVEIMKSYQLLRIDLDNLVEICTWPKQKNIMADIHSNVKMAFTRLYNKEVPIFSYSVNEATSKKRAAALYDDELNEDEAEEVSDSDDKVGKDNLIKVKKAKPSKKDSSKNSSTKQRSNTKGKAKK